MKVLCSSVNKKQITVVAFVFVCRLGLEGELAFNCVSKTSVVLLLTDSLHYFVNHIVLTYYYSCVLLHFCYSVECAVC
jgi:hypothetical protein